MRVAHLVLFCATLIGVARADTPDEDWQRWKLIHNDRTTLVSLSQCNRIELEVRAVRGRRGTLLIHVDDAPRPREVPIEIKSTLVVEAQTLDVARFRTGFRGRYRVVGTCGQG